MDIFDQISAVIKLHSEINDFELFSDKQYNTCVKVSGNVLIVEMYWTCSTLPQSRTLDNITLLLKQEFDGKYIVKYRVCSPQIVMTTVEFNINSNNTLPEQSSTSDFVYNEEYAEHIVNLLIAPMSKYVLPPQVTWRIVAVRWLQEDNMTPEEYASRLGLPVSIIKVAYREWENIAHLSIRPGLRPFLKL